MATSSLPSSPYTLSPSTASIATPATSITTTSTSSSASSSSPAAWHCPFGCGQTYRRSSGRSIRRHVNSCFRQHNAAAASLSDSEVSALIGAQQDSGKLHTGIRRWRMRNTRRRAAALSDHDRWDCVWECGKSYRSTSSRSIQRHANQCSMRADGLQGDADVRRPRGRGLVTDEHGEQRVSEHDTGSEGDNELSCWYRPINSLFDSLDRHPVTAQHELIEVLRLRVAVAEAALLQQQHTAAEGGEQEHYYQHHYSTPPLQPHSAARLPATWPRSRSELAPPPAPPAGLSAPLDLRMTDDGEEEWQSSSLLFLNAIDGSIPAPSFHPTSSRLCSRPLLHQSAINTPPHR